MNKMPDSNKLVSLAIKRCVDCEELTVQYIYDQYLKQLDHNSQDEFIDKLRSKLLEIMRSEETDKKINTDYYNGQIKVLTEKHYQQIYNTLIYLAKWKPLNNIDEESGKILCAITLDEIQPGNIISLSTGHRYNATSLITSDSDKDPVSGMLLSQRDRNRILASKVSHHGSNMPLFLKSLAKTLFWGVATLALGAIILMSTFILVALVASPLLFLGGILGLIGTGVGFTICSKFLLDSSLETENQYKQYKKYKTYKDTKSESSDPDESDINDPDESDINDPEKMESESITVEPYQPVGSSLTFFQGSEGESKTGAAHSSVIDSDSDEKTPLLMARSWS